MLQSIRDKSSGWIASLILGLIIIGMAFFGITDYLTPKVDTYAAKVEGPKKFWVLGGDSREIRVDEFRTRFEQVRARQRQAEGEAFNAAAFETADNKRLVLEQLIDEAVLELVAKRDGLAVSREQLQATIADVERFQVNGRFNQELYIRELKARGQTSAQFEQLVRDSAVQELLPAEVAASALAGDAELDSFLRLSQQTRHVRLLEIPPATEPPAPPSEADVLAWYNDHAAKYRAPESVTVDYLELDGNSLPVAQEADDKALRALYESEKLRFGLPEQRVASHIQVSVAANAPAAAWAAAEAKAKDIAAKVRAGADFATLAREVSDDVGTKDSGGDLGPMEKESNELGPTVYSLPLGGVSDPVRTSQGWHVVQYRELIAGSTKPFEEVRPQLEAEYLQNAHDSAFNDASNALIEAVYATPTAIASVAKKVNLPVRRSGSFSRDAGEGIASLAPVRKAAFEDEQKTERKVSEPVDIGPNHVVVLQVVEHRPEAAQPLAQVHDRVVADLLADRAETMLKERAEKLLARAKAGETLDALALETGRTVADIPTMGRTPPAAQFAPLVNAAFELPRPAAGKTGLALARTPSGEYALVEVVSVQDGDPAKVDAKTRTELRGQLAQARGMEDSRAFVRALRKRFKVTIAEDRL
jgi:peptidyl-prolyl cis-trans isomerase D